MHPLFHMYAARICIVFLLALAQIAQAGADEQYDRGLLWRIEKAGHAPSYVFGTVHVDDPRVTRLPEPVVRRFDTATSFTMEVVFDPAAVTRLATRMVYSDGRDLLKVAGADLYGKVAKAAGSAGMPPEVLRLFKPWAVSMLLIMPQLEHGEILDVMLMRRAREQLKAVHELETVDEQVALFENLPEHDQLLMLRHTIDNLDASRRGLRELVDAWLARDLAAIAKISDRIESTDPEIISFNERFTVQLLDERNKRMVSRMQSRLRAGGAFIAIGALHLHGARGVLALLAREGYVVTREY